MPARPGPVMSAASITGTVFSRPVRFQEIDRQLTGRTPSRPPTAAIRTGRAAGGSAPGYGGVVTETVAWSS